MGAARGFLGACGFLGAGSGSSGGSLSTIGSSGAGSMIFGFFLLPGGRPRRLGTGTSSATESRPSGPASVVSVEVAVALSQGCGLALGAERGQPREFLQALVR